MFSLVVLSFVRLCLFLSTLFTFGLLHLSLAGCAQFCPLALSLVRLCSVLSVCVYFSLAPFCFYVFLFCSFAVKEVVIKIIHTQHNFEKERRKKRRRKSNKTRSIPIKSLAAQKCLLHQNSIKHSLLKTVPDGKSEWISFSKCMPYNNSRSAAMLYTQFLFSSHTK